jgi:hypothetical protein
VSAAEGANFYRRVFQGRLRSFETAIESGKCGLRSIATGDHATKKGPTLNFKVGPFDNDIG